VIRCPSICQLRGVDKVEESRVTGELTRSGEFASANIHTEMISIFEIRFFALFRD